MKYIDDINLILEMAEKEDERMVSLLIDILNIPIVYKTPDGGLINAPI